MLTSKTVTVKDVLSWRPCYGEGRTRATLAGKAEWTALDFLDLEIPPADRLWCVLRPQVLGPEGCVLAACLLVRETPLADGRKVWDLLTDERSRAAVEAAERWARGTASPAESAEAARAAEAAAGAAAAGAAEAAARAAEAAAWAAAWAAARAAAGAAEAAARAAEAAAGASQIETLRRALAVGGAPCSS